MAGGWRAAGRSVVLGGWVGLCGGVGGVLNGAGWIYGLGLIVVACCLVREHLLVRSFGVAKINEAFFLMNAVVSFALFAAAVLDVLL